MYGQTLRTDKEHDMFNVEQVPAYFWQSWLDANRGLLIDVREPGEWAAGVLPGAERISLGMLPYRIHQLDKHRPVMLVCRSGARSSQAAEILASAGFRRVANLAGGMASLGLA